MMSSIRLPVSTSTVAIIVRLPPSSMLRAAPKKRFGLSSAPGARPPLIARPPGLSALQARASRVRLSISTTTFFPCSTSRCARS